MSAPLLERLETLPEFLQRVSTQEKPRWLVRDLLPQFGITMWHGDPRDMKSMTALATGLDLARGRDVFGNPRFKVEKPAVVAYVTEEDSEFEVRLRVSRLCEGLGVPPTFYPIVRGGLNFDDPAQQQAIIDWLTCNGAELVCFDPLRAFTAHADKGPADFQPVTRFLRRIQNETDCKSILIIHHDVKPSRDAQPSARKRSHNASGGAVFSISDCLASFQKTEWNQTVVRAEDYKVATDPKPFTVIFDTPLTLTENGEPTFGAWIKPTVSTEVDEGESKLLKALAKGDTPLTCSQWEGALGLRKGSVAPMMLKLARKGVVRLLAGPELKALGKRADAKVYVVADAPPVGDPDGPPQPASPPDALASPSSRSLPRDSGVDKSTALLASPPPVGGEGSGGFAGRVSRSSILQPPPSLGEDSGATARPADPLSLHPESVEPFNPYENMAEGAEVVS